MKPRIGFNQGMILPILLLMSACSQGILEEPVADYEAARDYQVMALRTDDSSDGSAPVLASLPGQTRKLVLRAELQIRVADPAASEQTLTTALDRYGAYTAATRRYEGRRNYTIRVQTASYEPLLAELHRIGKVIKGVESAEDVSLTYYDLEGRLATKQELLKTFQSYLGKAKTIEEIMTVEQRIAELQYEIDRTGTKFSALSDQIQYATIELTLLGPALPSGSGLRERIGDLCGSFGYYLSIAVVVFLGIIMYGIPGILVLLLFYWLFFGKIGLIKKLWRILSGK
ncbi:MAG: DUF4349 domain-containing protein [Treponema sp.]|jgi:hypothetical protein|nr:DUF4349 domain-containing protein [Treponema sp.]